MSPRPAWEQTRSPNLVIGQSAGVANELFGRHVDEIDHALTVVAHLDTQHHAMSARGPQKHCPGQSGRFVAGSEQELCELGGDSWWVGVCRIGRHR